MVPNTPPDVTDAELAVLQALWEQGEATIRRLTDALYPEGKAAHYATVQKLLERLEAKGCVRRDRAPWPHRFTAAVDRDTLIGWRLRATAEKLCGGSEQEDSPHFPSLQGDSSGSSGEAAGAPGRAAYFA